MGCLPSNVRSVVSYTFAAVIPVKVNNNDWGVLITTDYWLDDFSVVFYMWN
jgi:hypothetical protein